MELKIAGISYTVNEIRTKEIVTLPGAGMITSSILNGNGERGVCAYANIGGRTFFKNCVDTESAVAWLQKKYDDFGNIHGFARFKKAIENGAAL